MTRVRRRPCTDWFVGLMAAAMIATAVEAKPASHAFNVRALYASCKSASGSQAETFCLGYIEGVGQFMAINAEYLQRENGSWLRETSLCAKPVGGWPSGGAMKHAFANWAAKHPKNWSLGAAAGVVLALRDKWPCKIKPGGTPDRR